MVDITWEVTDAELDDQWERGQTYAHNFGLWASGRSRKEVDDTVAAMWQAFLNQWDPQPQRLLHYTMVTAMERRFDMLRTWN
jgi:hypothetical protein